MLFVRGLMTDVGRWFSFVLRNVPSRLWLYQKKGGKMDRKKGAVVVTKLGYRCS